MPRVSRLLQSLAINNKLKTCIRENKIKKTNKMLPAKVHFRSDFPVMKKQLAFHLQRSDLDVCQISSGIRVDIGNVSNHWLMNASFLTAAASTPRPRRRACERCTAFRIPLFVSLRDTCLGFCFTLKNNLLLFIL